MSYISHILNFFIKFYIFVVIFIIFMIWTIWWLFHYSYCYFIRFWQFGRWFGTARYYDLGNGRKYNHLCQNIQVCTFKRRIKWPLIFCCSVVYFCLLLFSSSIFCAYFSQLFFFFFCILFWFFISFVLSWLIKRIPFSAVWMFQFNFLLLFID